MAGRRGRFGDKCVDCGIWCYHTRRCVFDTEEWTHGYDDLPDGMGQ